MFLKKEDILGAAGEREIIFWGCSEDWVPKSKKLLPFVVLAVDINWERIGEKWMDLKVTSPSKILEKRDQFFIVITTGSYESVEEVLQISGWQPGLDYCYSPVYLEFKNSRSVSEVSGKLLVASSDYGVSGDYRSSRLGGGLYQISFNCGYITEINRLSEGSYRQGQFSDGAYYTIDYVKNEFQVFDSDWNQAENILLNLRHYTGISVDNGYAYLISSAYDCIEILDIKYKKIIHRRQFSDRSGKRGEGLHHLNDCCFRDGVLFFSYFSRSGVWRNEIFDGGISFFDLKEDRILDALGGLFQPHSPTMINDQLHFCESPRGYVYASSWERLCSFPGFVRGLDYRNGRYFVGQSETLYMKRAKNIPNVMMNTGVYCVDSSSGSARFLAIDGIKNVHSVHAIDCF
ncbi:hypothetical protein ThidrDRAFT_4220 [Thiorhodococcus drewsii AZ1]|uniref:Conserved hypothetical protein CHP03032 domain-containing protein n=1 Tax=Thiorhodococcus drewsii AZ1 TaxID=765913 RepID=G2E7F7_9GAMM|nr:DUF4915 domain-containing protein [Thiorhodococcus drewsii]EGV27996.1 hypothetical protein ThidrDRAFT_4220 [Thiorhodococcus drewsii AZ1]